jgi:streptomycin 6-kinase
VFLASFIVQKSSDERNPESTTLSKPCIIPKSFARRMVEVYQAEGQRWLERLPALLDECAAQWSLDVLPPFDELSYNYVAPAIRQDGKEVCSSWWPTPSLSPDGCAAPVRWTRRGALLRSDADRRAAAGRLPGTMLVSLDDDDEATAIAAQVMLALWRPVPAVHRCPSVMGWARAFARLRARFGGGTGPLPPDYVALAERLFPELTASASRMAVLHGDLHHYNILATQGSSWLAIDPKGVVGDPAYEVGALLHNPLHLLQIPHPERIMARRVDILAEALEIDRARIVGWGAAAAVLSACWSTEDEGHGWDHALGCLGY